MNEKEIMRMLKEVLEDKKTGCWYWFDIEAYKDRILHLSTRDILIQLELKTNIEIGSEETVKRRIRRFNNYVNGCKDAVPGDLAFIKKLGIALADNEMAFLMPITPESFSYIADNYKNQIDFDGAGVIYRNLNQLLYLLESSCYFYYIPNSKEKNGQTYFNERLLDIRKSADDTYADKPQVRKRLQELINEVDCILTTSDVPGVPDKWLELNPRLRYFDCAYELLTDESLMCRLKFIPPIAEVLERKKYFEEKHRMFPTRSDDRLYQDELVETLNIRFNECMKSIKKDMNLSR